MSEQLFLKLMTTNSLYTSWYILIFLTLQNLTTDNLKRALAFYKMSLLFFGASSTLPARNRQLIATTCGQYLNCCKQDDDQKPTQQHIITIHMIHTCADAHARARAHTHTHTHTHTHAHTHTHTGMHIVGSLLKDFTNLVQHTWSYNNTWQLGESHNVMCFLCYYTINDYWWAKYVPCLLAVWSIIQWASV